MKCEHIQNEPVDLSAGFLFCLDGKYTLLCAMINGEVMTRNRILANMAIAVMLIAVVALTGACKKQPKCGCDGDALDTLEMMHVYISYDAETKTARFSPKYDAYSVYYFCNPSDWMSELSKFNQGDEILISGPYFYECNYLMNAGNSYQTSYMKVYQIDVSYVGAYEYGK
jgi:hypothetical protein